MDRDDATDGITRGLTVAGQPDAIARGKAAVTAFLVKFEHGSGGQRSGAGFNSNQQPLGGQQSPGTWSMPNPAQQMQQQQQAQWAAYYAAQGQQQQGGYAPPPAAPPAANAHYQIQMQSFQYYGGYWTGGSSGGTWVAVSSLAPSAIWSLLVIDDTLLTDCSW